MAIDNTRRQMFGTAVALGLASAAAFVVAKPKERIFKIVAKKFDFVPSTIRVKKGESVTLMFTAPEIFMGVNFADLGMRVDIVPGKVATLRFTPDKVGSFTFLCDVFCGKGHEDMSGTLVVSA